MGVAAPALVPVPPRPAIIGLVKGGTRPGRIVRFDPLHSDLTIETGPGTAALGRRIRIPAERVAYVAFRRGDRPPGRHGASALRVHVCGGETLEVVVDPDALRGPVGFWAAASNEDDPVGEYYFYAHGVLAKERCEPIGSFLVRQGSLTPNTLAAGIEQQASEQATTIGELLVARETVTHEQADAAADLQKRKKMRIGEILVEEGFATDKDIQAALGEQKRRRGKRLGEVLVDMGAITEVDLALALANKFDLDFVNLEELAIEPKAMREVPRNVVERFGVLPVQSDFDSLTVAIADPLCVDAVEAIRMFQPKRVIEVLATKSQLARVVARFLDGGPVGNNGIDDLVREAADDGSQELDDHDVSVDASDSAVIKLVNQVILDGYRRGASDIHIEPNGRRASTRIRFRIDGECVTYREVPPALRAPLVARLKIMARLDIAERRKPQDGKIRFRLQDKNIELRVATIPTVANNEDVVMRILANARPIPLAEMGLSRRNLTALKAAIAQPFGLVLCVGPTGSGKTTTLHSALAERNVEGTKIWTAEDPVEITQLGLRQVQVNAKIGFTFAAALRSFLRADPDVIMVGEMRDLETATMGIEASLTGHMVMSTLHTNSAPETVTRLVDMGLDPFSFSDALVAVLAQRLVRRLCRCRKAYDADPQEWKQLVERYGAATFETDRGSLAPMALYRASGCARCGGSGYKGRVAIHELLVSNEVLNAAIQRKAPADEIRQLAIAGGMRTLLQDGISKALGGETDVGQVLSICGR
jgi:type II secretory ATPase GspE/PulE/Tfp pilus assembly ATPase PilB-like protein